MDVTLMKTPWPHTDVTVDVKKKPCEALLRWHYHVEILDEYALL